MEVMCVYRIICMNVLIAKCGRILSKFLVFFLIYMPLIVKVWISLMSCIFAKIESTHCDHLFFIFLAIRIVSNRLEKALKCTLNIQHDWENCIQQTSTRYIFVPKPSHSHTLNQTIVKWIYRHNINVIRKYMYVTTNYNIYYNAALMYLSSSITIHAADNKCYSNHFCRLRLQFSEQKSTIKKKKNQRRETHRHLRQANKMEKTSRK